MRDIILLILGALWLAGIAIAKGFWYKFFAIIIPMYAHYLVIEQLMLKYFL
jgi:hypothetical protein